MLELAAATPGASSVAILAAFASTNGSQTITTFLAGGLTELATRPRNLRVTVGAGGTPGQSYTSMVATGVDIDGNALTETVTITAAAGNYDSVKAFAGLTSLAFSGGTGAGASLSVGYANLFGLPTSIKSRGGRLAVIQEVANGAVVTNGTFASPATSPPHGTYSPNTAPDTTKPYAVTYEQVVP
jgi:hypothetical protein